MMVDDGQIEGIHETMSEYFGGEAAQRLHANGFEDLKSLGELQITSSNLAYTNESGPINNACGTSSIADNACWQKAA